MAMAGGQRAIYKRRRLNTSIFKYFSSSQVVAPCATAEESGEERDGDQESTDDLTGDTVPSTSNSLSSISSPCTDL